MRGSAWKRWNWVEWGIVPLVCTMMVAAWVAPLLQFILGLAIVQPKGLDYPAWLAMSLLLGASAAKSLLPRTKAGRAISALIGVVVIFVVLSGLSPYRDPSSAWPHVSMGPTIRSLAQWGEGIPATFLLVVMSAALWARGLAADWTAHDELWRAFALGVVVLGLLLLLSGRGGAMQGVALGQAVMSFLLTGLLALALLAVLDVLSIQQPFGKRAAGLNRYWLSAVFLALLVIVFLGWLLGQILAPDAVAQFIRWFDPLRRFLGQVLSLVLTAVVYLFFTALMAIYRLISRWIKQPENDTSQFMKAGEDLLREIEERTPSFRISPDLQLVLVLLFLFLGALALFWLVWRQKRRRVGRDKVLEERQSIGSVELLLDQLSKLFKHPPQVDPFLDLSSIAGSRRAIRLLYQRILAAATAVGHPRTPGQTPATYERSLARLVPAEKPDLRTLTDAYTLARYGEQAPTDDAVSKAGDATARIEQALHQHQKR